jgi:hypothetical protein
MSYIVGFGKNWIASKQEVSGEMFDVLTGTVRGVIVTVRTKEFSNMAEVFIGGNREGRMHLDDVESFVRDKLNGG